MSTRLYLALLASPRMRALVRVSCSMSTLARMPQAHFASSCLPECLAAGGSVGIDALTGSACRNHFDLRLRRNRLALNQTKPMRQP